jgi:hypothetical protein
MEEARTSQQMNDVAGGWAFRAWWPRVRLVAR